jgi:hypothetical protein
MTGSKSRGTPSEDFDFDFSKLGITELRTLAVDGTLADSLMIGLVCSTRGIAPKILRFLRIVNAVVTNDLTRPVDLAQSLLPVLSH